MPKVESLFSITKRIPYVGSNGSSVVIGSLSSWDEGHLQGSDGPKPTNMMFALIVMHNKIIAHKRGEELYAFLQEFYACSFQSELNLLLQLVQSIVG